jgi:uncharacterized protein YecE (DUF72 family)
MQNETTTVLNATTDERQPQHVGKLMQVSEPELKIGTSGYSYPGPPPKGWYGIFYPTTRGKKIDELEFYSQFFDTVEVNSTFYRPPVPNMAKAWAIRTPPSFEFSVKLWQKFTHPRKIGQGVSKEQWELITQDDIDLFRSGIQPLAEAGKLGALLLQYPMGFYCSPENIDKLDRTLRSFAEYPKAVELRHRSWSDRAEQTKALLQEHDASLVLIDEPKFASSIRQGFETVGQILYFRAHGRNIAKWWNHKESWERYDYCYSWDEIKEMAQKLKTAAGSRPDLGKALVFFNNHARGQAATNAFMLQHELGIPIKASPVEALTRAFPQISEMIPKPGPGRQAGLF